MMDFYEKLRNNSNLICFWDFSEEEGKDRISKSQYQYSLKEMGGPIKRSSEGVFGNYSAVMEGGSWFNIKREDCPALDIHGKNAQFTIFAWIKRNYKEEKECQAIAGMWNETKSQRQYCMFIDLVIWNSKDQVCGHVSSTGGPTESYKYCMDAAIGSTYVTIDEWHFIAVTYDGIFARAYLDGRLDRREKYNPYFYDQGIYDGGKNGADFTVGSVTRSGETGNWFIGKIGGLAVYNRALDEKEIEEINKETEKHIHLLKD